MEPENTHTPMLGDDLSEMRPSRSRSPSQGLMQPDGEDLDAEGSAMKSGADLEGLKCRNCGYEKQMNEKLVMGCVAWSWVAILFLLTAVFFFLPFFCKFCKDKKFNCPKCGETAGEELARCL